MHLQDTQSAGPAEAIQVQEKELKQFVEKSTTLPFGQDVSLSSISGPTYLTAQTLVQQVAYTLSDKIFSYSPDTFDLDVALKTWSAQKELNAYGYATGVSAMETRTGAGSIALGYMFSEDFDLKKRHIPQTLVASSSSLQQLRPALDELALLYSVANPLVAHVAAVDYVADSKSGFVSDYETSFAIAEDLGLGLISSASVFEVQHMSLFSTLVSSIMPTIHTYDGISIGRETTRVIDVLSQKSLFDNYSAILKSVDGSEKKHSFNEARVVKLLKAFNDELGTDYRLFEYYGHQEAETVVVVFGTIEASLGAQVARSLSKSGGTVGLINVRVYRPFVEEEFVAALPKTVKNVAVLGQVENETVVADVDAHSRLYSDVLAATTFTFGGPAPIVVADIKYSREQTWSPKLMAEVFQEATGNQGFAVAADSTLDGLDSETQQYSFWQCDNSASMDAPIVIGNLLSKDSAINVSISTRHDNLVQGGVTKTEIRTSQKSIEASYSIDQADFALVAEGLLLQEFDILNTLKLNATLVIKLPGVKDEDLEKKIPAVVRKAIVSKNINLFVYDPTACELVVEDAKLETYLTQLVFLRLAQNDTLNAGQQKLAAINGSQEMLEVLAADLDKVIHQISIPESWATIEEDVEIASLPTNINSNSFEIFEKIEPEPETFLKDWATVAKGLAFKEAYGTKEALRPDLGVKTYVSHIKERRRLTPLDYDRNIFHIEFDLGDSGLKYAIGEALGVHAENDKTEVEEFIKWYGLNAEDVVEVPSREDPNVLENRTIYQALVQNVDIFGRPPKRFYEALAEFASDKAQQDELLSLGGSTKEGVQEFQRRAEVDTTTYADILLEFDSAHPSFHDIVRIVSPMKRREYSIASSQRVTPTSVSLLIVTVGWVDPKGRDRFGQATRYLNSLPVGAPVTVSVKPSVMKLPPKTTAPIIMAGLGTGLAPFRAFVQERALQKQEGHDIGAVMLYMGSRHQREEYLYGEEWEAYQDAGVITLLGRAFSRDQPQKIYIQDRMRQTLRNIRKAYLEEEGSFYLCGPTWPVPDVTQVLQEAVEEERRAEGMDAKKINSRREIETLKDQGRYVLEVY
ncbi:sulfite reductase-like protein alpha subunit [Pseudovirgaria hyperparasitica]|uniref:assimilatory sulfite reductase (NADPH) n=1 Tax=Pseudovirgaria hyperparasitica TaxID=470096 RepID=A0A6A6WCQ7_9PEZI|nr:sulfite reductase-like protein alpha subunit [Pseudovirgaria hyperparasitica]KAF2760355.1 sulfite reductase-like protein alpha subunit [Pseudovirgaria hyperparasitica]